MRFFVFKIKHIIFAVMLLVTVTAVCISSGSAVMTFLVNGRELPIYSVEREDNAIALTFDCAWNDDDIDVIVDTLNKYDCKATFFVTGKWAEDYSDSLNRIYRSGYEVGIHSYNHADYTKLGKDEILEDMNKCDRAVMKATGFKPYLMRAPSGAYNDNVVRTVENSGRQCIQWSVDGLDYVDTTEEEIFNRVVSKTNNGDIILLHNGTELTSSVLPQILERLKKDFTLVNISDLIYKNNYTINHTGRQFPKKFY